MVVHYAAWIVIPTLIWGPIAIAVYATIWGLSGVCLALVFAPAHIGLPVMTGQNKDWLHQLETTRNLEMPRVISFFFIGLDYQVEHHLFPKIPHMNLPRAAEITKAWCAKHKVVYMTGPYLAALGDAVQFLSNAWERDAVSPSEVRAMLLDAVA
jgi:fatty acid desaturase